MDRSMDSIGSCSLDVDAESSDISDTSGSLNFPTPISIKDITREFTANIRERCSVQTVKNNTTAYVDPVTGQVCIALVTTQPPPSSAATVNNNIATVESHNKSTVANLLSPQTPVDTYEKKPSYLNLACCVNGYSNITTYDSKIRQDINKSREVSPIRPSSSSLQYCKKSNSLAPPVLLAMPNVNVTSPHHHHHHHLSTNGGGIMTSIGTKYTIIENNNISQNGSDSLHNISVGDDVASAGSNSSTNRSFIQQRVERLYGPGALAQGFYSPKKLRDSPQRLNRSHTTENGGGTVSELSRKFQELSPSKDYNKFREKLSSNGRPPIPASLSSSAAENLNTENNNIDLPCLRHLSREFRAQLPIVSPKRNFSRSSPGRELTTTANTNSTITNTTNNTNTNETQNYSTSNGTSTTTTTNHHHISEHNSVTTSAFNSPAAGSGGLDEVDRQVLVETIELPQTPTSKLAEKLPLEVVVPSPNALISLEEKLPLEVVVPPPNALISLETGQPSANVETPTTSNGSVAPVRDAHFFLKQLKGEQNRLLEMAAVGEKYLDALASNPDITEDTLGLLRSASGKARLLVSQKMKQFEGLCHNNLNSSPEDQFPTTVDDLQGFWDMVYLQVDHIDCIFKDIEILKANEWKRPANLLTPSMSSNSSNALKTPKTNKTFKTRVNTPLTNGGGSGGSGSVPSTPSAAALKREAQRKKLQEMKKRNREAMVAAQQTSSPVTDASAAAIDGIEILEASSNKQQQDS